MSTWEERMTPDHEVTMRPIGLVVRNQAGSKGFDTTDRALAEIEIEEAWSEALDGIDGFSHIWVLWWIDRSPDTPSAQRVHPEGRTEIPLVGFFATRSPHRPNPLGLTCVRLLRRHGQILHVQGLDAFVGTPILDIKPYLRRGDRIEEPTVPPWLERLWDIHDQESSV
jgi:tRNA-Thr(GGU) m(6)t(6)A37 methyltransferase TsaA